MITAIVTLSILLALACAIALGEFLQRVHAEDSAEAHEERCTKLDLERRALIKERDDLVMKAKAARPGPFCDRRGGILTLLVLAIALIGCGCFVVVGAIARDWASCVTSGAIGILVACSLWYAGATPLEVPDEKELQ